LGELSQIGYDYLVPQMGYTGYLAIFAMNCALSGFHPYPLGLASFGQLYHNRVLQEVLLGMLALCDHRERADVGTIYQPDHQGPALLRGATPAGREKLGSCGNSG